MLIFFLTLIVLIALIYFIYHGRKGHEVLKVIGQYRYAHRGYHDKPQIPENSIPAFKRAVERGWGAELDVHILKDGTLVVIHDSALSRTTGAEGTVEELTKEELKNYHLEGTEETIPLFDDVLDIFEGKTPLIIELKPANGNHRELAEAVCNRMDRYKGVFCLESFDARAVADVKKLRPKFCRGILSQNFFKVRSGRNLAQALYETSLVSNVISRPDFVAFHYPARKCITNRLCTKVLGIQSVSWTIRSKEDLLTAEAEGAVPIFEKFDPDMDVIK